MSKQSSVQSSIAKHTTKVTQPRGGYLNPNLFQQEPIDDARTLYPNENLHPALVGVVVDYLTRFMVGIPKEKAFAVSLLGADIFEKTYPESSQFKTQSTVKQTDELLSSINSLNATSIISACKLAGYDVCARSSIAGYKPIETINPNEKTVYNIAVMVQRSIEFWRSNDPIIAAGLPFEHGYTKNITHGFSGYVTENTLCDFRVSKNEINNRHTLCLLIAYIMGRHVYPALFAPIQKLSIYNPRLNKHYTIPLHEISMSTMLEIEGNVIGYKDTALL